MTTRRPHKGLHNVIASHPYEWVLVVPHATNYLRGNAGDHTVAVALKAGDAGVIQFIDMGDTVNPKSMTFQAGEVLPGEFLRVLAAETTSTEIWAAFIEV